MTEMTSTERVRRTILGQPTDRQPIYGWVAANLSNEISAQYGSVAAFEDHYEYDAAHLFGGPGPFNKPLIDRIREENGELTPDLLVDEPIFTDPDHIEDYQNLADSLAFHKQRGRFCYVQTPGFFETFNDVFGIQDQLMWLALYPDELKELYRRQSEWDIRFADHCLDLGIDMIHVSDDWGSQTDLMFNPDLWWDLIYPAFQPLADHVHNRGAFVSLHSDGCIKKVADGVKKLGINVVHPWQEAAGMDYDFYLDNFKDSFAIMGGICVQTKLGLVDQKALEEDIRRVFGLLRGKRWICCTTHFVQNHCTMDHLNFAYDLIYKLAREKAPD